MAVQVTRSEKTPFSKLLTILKKAMMRNPRFQTLSEVQLESRENTDDPEMIEMVAPSSQTVAEEESFQAQEVSTDKEPESRGACPLAQVPTDVLIEITTRLDVVSLACLKYTSSGFRDAITIKDSELSRCARWKVSCYLEFDLIYYRKSIPERLNCAFCKRKHKMMRFIVPFSSKGYGTQCLRRVMRDDPLARYCCLHVPKRINLSPTHLDPQQRWANWLEIDQWVMTVEPVCLHCGDRLQEDTETEESTCPSCISKCSVCGHGMLHNFNRYGQY